MPDAATLQEIYGSQYLETWYSAEKDATSLSAIPEMPAETSDNARVVALLENQPSGVFLDYGCGAGHLLKDAMRIGWKAVGVEFDREVARSVASRTAARVVSDSAELGTAPVADVLHLGDVLEHLTQIETQMPAILGLLKPGGTLVAQGPLENNANLFTLTLRLARTLRGSPKTEAAPYHVLLATARGQREMFRRFGLRELQYSVSEVAWPAPLRLPAKALRQPRSTGLFVLRRASQLLSAIVPGRWGNRYFYAGRWN